MAELVLVIRQKFNDNRSTSEKKMNKLALHLDHRSINVCSGLGLRLQTMICASILHLLIKNEFEDIVILR